MASHLQRIIEADPLKRHWLFRYGLAILLFAATLGLSYALRFYEVKINLTIPVVFALVAAAWYGGRGPGLLVGVLFQLSTIFLSTAPQEPDLAKRWFGYFSIFSLYVFLVWVISGLRRTQVSLAEQRDLLQVTLSSIGDGVIATDQGGAITFMNPVAEKLTGWETDSVKGKALSEVFKVLREDTREPVADPVQQVLANETTEGDADHNILVSRSGAEIPVANSAAPIVHRGEVKGVVLVFSDVTERKLAERARRETEIMHRLVEAQEAERHRIARDLHDHLGQKMTALRLKIESLLKKFGDFSEHNPAIEEVQAAAKTIDQDIGFLSWELRPTELDQFGLENALATFVREWSGQYGVSAEFHAELPESHDDSQRLSKTAETNLYRIAQEGLNNILKHADARNVTVLLQQRKNDMLLIIEDDGCGFVEKSNGTGKLVKPAGLGLIGMKERAALLHGTLNVDTQPGGGTSILARIPLDFESN